MKAFIESIDEKAWHSILTNREPPIVYVDGVKTPKLEVTWTIDEDKLTNVNSKALNVIFNGIDHPCECS